MTARVSGTRDEDASPVGSLAIDGATNLLGRASNLVRILAAHSPYLATWFCGFVAAVRQPGLGATSDIRLRNIATIRTSAVNECSYCTTHTSIFGQTLGLTDDELAAIQSDAFRESPLLTDREKVAIAWAEAVARNTAARDTSLWEEVKTTFTDSEIVEITLASAMFSMINRLNDTFWTELEPSEYNLRQGNVIHSLSIDDIEAYASRFAAVGRSQHAGTGTQE